MTDNALRWGRELAYDAPSTDAADGARHRRVGDRAGLPRTARAAEGRRILGVRHARHRGRGLEDNSPRKAAST